MRKYLIGFIVAFVAAVSFHASPASAQGHGQDRKSGFVASGVLVSAIAEHSKAVGEDISLGNVSYDATCYLCGTQAHNESGDGSHVDIDMCDIEVKDPVHGKTDHQHASLSSWQHEGQGGGGSWMQLDPNDVVISKGRLEVVSLGIVCTAVESGSNHDFDIRSRYDYEDGYYSRWRSRGRSEAADVTGIEHPISGDVWIDSYLEHFSSRSSYPYSESGGGKG